MLVFYFNTNKTAKLTKLRIDSTQKVTAIQKKAITEK